MTDREVLSKDAGIGNVPAATIFQMTDNYGSVIRPLDICDRRAVDIDGETLAGFLFGRKSDPHMRPQLTAYNNS
ncbi:MAG: hypothetical protein FJX25_05325 [Alphaproteobacteria bacterium]|nr:hypothetical protein [Alphaproteobacteria bacterium]